MSAVVYLDPEQLVAHPDLAIVPTVKECANHVETKGKNQSRADMRDGFLADWRNFLREIAENGILEPVKIAMNPDGGWWIVDGRHRVEAVKDLRKLNSSIAEHLGMGDQTLDESRWKSDIPCVEVEGIGVDDILEATNLGRRHFTKSALAWIAVKMTAKDRRTKAGRPKNCPLNTQLTDDDLTENDLRTQQEIADHFGVSRALLNEAIRLYKETDGAPNKRKEREASIFAGSSLKSVLGSKPGNDRNRQKAENGEGKYGAETFLRELRLCGTRLQGYQHWSPVEQEKAEVSILGLVKSALDSGIELPVNRAELDELLERFSEGGAA